MCSLCGVLAGRGHWADSSQSPAVFQSREDKTTRQRERQGTVRLANRILRHYGLTLSDWGAASYILRSATGRTVLVANLTELWAAAEKILQSPCDPLEPALLAAVSGEPTPR